MTLAFEPVKNRAHTKIVATVGPACRSEEKLRALVGAGVDVFRLNMAHGSRAEHEKTIQGIRNAAQEGDRPIAILVDLAGPKIRLGPVSPDPLTCSTDEILHIVNGASTTPTELSSNYEPLVSELSVGDRVMLADGTVELRVIDKQPDRAICRVVGPGSIRSRQGINLPGVRLGVPAMNEVDRQNAAWAAQHDVDFVSLSFVRQPADILQLKELLRQNGGHALAISKIEKPEALEQLDEILEASDGVMVARGDLGVEIDVAEMPVRQKEIVAACRAQQKPVIVATQMLDSMQRSSQPTRAETTDVANAIYDGADACMLSGETAIGQYPVESVQMMNRIMLCTEASLAADDARGSRVNPRGHKVHPITSAVVASSSTIARKLDAKLVVIATRSGTTALAKAHQRDFVRTVAVSDSEATLRQMCLYWGIMPLLGAPHDLDRALLPFVDDWGRQHGILQQGDLVVIVAGAHVRAGAHNQLIVHEIE